MPKPNKIIFWISIAFIVLVIVFQVLLHTLPLQFATSSYEDGVGVISFFSLTVAILLTLCGTVKSSDSPPLKLGKIVLTMIVAAVPLLFAFVTTLDLCAWSTDRVLFTNNDNNQKIVLRSFGCGAVDSSGPDYEIDKITPVTPFFIWVTKADTTTIDKRVWRRVSQ